MVWIKRLLLLLAGLLSVVLILLAYVALLLDPNDFKDELKTLAQDEANIHLRFDGDIKWSFYPWLGFELENIGVAMIRNDVTSDTEILRFDRAEFGLALLPLLQQEIQVNKVNLVNVTANLMKDRNGQGNWQSAEQEVNNENSILNATTKTTTQSSPQSTSSAAINQKSGFTFPDVKLELLRIENAQLHYRDEQTNQKMTLIVNAQVDDVEWDRIWPIAVDVAFTQSDLQGDAPVNVNAQLNANLSVFPERQFFSVDSLVLTSQLQSDALPTDSVEAKLKAMKIGFDLPQENIAVDGLLLSTLGLNIDANLQAYQVLTTPSYSAKLSLGEFNPRTLLEGLKLPVPDMSDDSVLTHAQASFVLEGDTDSVTLHPAAVLFDETELEANAVVSFSPLRWDVSVTGENLNLDHYLPAEVKGESVSVDDQAEPLVSEVVNETVNELFPVDMMRDLNGHVDFAFENLIVKGITLDKVELDSTQHQGLIKVSPIAVTLYEGDFTAKMNLDVRDKEPSIDIVPNINGIQIQPLLMDFMDLEKISGATYLTGNITAEGNQVESLMSSLSGEVFVDIKQGALVGINLTKTVCEGVSSVRKESIDDSRFGDDTPFEIMSFPARIVNGQISTPGLTIRSAGVQVTGNGKVSLTDAYLDYVAQVGLSGSELDSSCRVNDQVAKLTFPIQCKGHFSDDPAGLCGPDIKGFTTLFTDVAKAALKQKVDEEKARLQAKLDVKLATEKAALKQRADEEKARLQAKLDAKLATEKAKLKAKRQEEEDALKEKLKNKLKSFF
ncbi:AsmA family protein [Marinomonas sp.]|nr:AsmA family protein [Marinomonas sp.]MDB4837566.1 AsmA family protein [Marinomonas sp.]